MELGNVLRLFQPIAIICLSVASHGTGLAQSASNGNSDAKTIVGMLEAWKSVAGRAATKSVEQAQSKYIAERQLDEAIVSARRADFKQAADLFKSSVEAYAKADILSGENLYGVHNVTGMLLLVQEQNDEALAEFNRARDVAERLKGKASVEVIAACRNAAICDIRAERNFERARGALLDALKGYQGLKMTDRAEYRSVLKWLAVCEVELKRNLEAIRYQTEVCDRLRARKVPNDMELADAIQILAQFYAHEKNWNSSRNCYDEAASIYEQLGGTDDPAAKSARENALEMSRLIQSKDE